MNEQQYFPFYVKPVCIFETFMKNSPIAKTKGEWKRVGGIGWCKKGGVVIHCPYHKEQTPSCSIFRIKTGQLRFRCFGCGESGSVYRLIEKVYNTEDYPPLPPKPMFDWKQKRLPFGVESDDIPF